MAIIKSDFSKEKALQEIKSLMDVNRPYFYEVKRTKEAESVDTITVVLKMFCMNGMKDDGGVLCPVCASLDYYALNNERNLVCNVCNTYFTKEDGK